MRKIINNKGHIVYLLLRAAIFLTVFIVLVGCDYMPFGYTPIGEVKIGPGRYEGQEVKVRGTVTSINQFPFIETKSYTLRDRTGEITVITDNTLPAMNENIAIKATVKSAVIFDGQSLGLRIEEIKKLNL